MFRIIFIIFLSCIFLKSGHATELDFVCELKQTGRTPFEYLIKWINPKTTHELSENKIIFKNSVKTEFLDREVYTGKVLKNEETKIVWEYSFKNELIKNWRGQHPRGRHKDDLWIMNFELRKSNNTVFFTGHYKNKKHKWVQGIGKCKIDNTKAIKKAEEKAKREAEIQAQKLAEEKAKRDAEIKAQKLAEERAQRDAEKKLAEERAKREAEIQAQKLAEEKAQLEAELKAQKLAEEKAKRKAELKAKKLAKEKAKKLAENRAKEDAERIKINLLKKESEELLFNVQSFAMDKKNDLDTLKLGMLFLNFKKSSKNGWNKETLDNYKLLKNFALSSANFKSFNENQKLVKLKKFNEEVSRLQKSIRGFEDILRSFVSVNLGSENSLEAINFANEINKLQKSKNLSKLSNLEKRLISWKSKNIKTTIPNKKEISNIRKENSKKTKNVNEYKTKNVNENKTEKDLKEFIIIKASGCKNYFNSDEKKDDFEKVVGYKYWTGFSIQYEIINKTSYPLVVRQIATEFSRDYGPFYTLLKTSTFAKPVLPDRSLLMKRDPHMFYTLAKESLNKKQIEELKNRHGCSLSNFEGQTIDLVKGQIKMKFPPEVKSLKPLDIIKIQNEIQNLDFKYR